MTLARAENGTTPSDRICGPMCARSQELAILPQVASEALKLIRHENADVQKISKLLERDLHLAAEILRLANSPVFGGCRDVVRISDAVIRIGLDRCQELILSSCTANLMKQVSLEQHWIRDLLWRHSYTTGVCCQILNAGLGLSYSGEDFAAGLIHDIGRLLLAVVVPDHFHEGDPLDFDESLGSLQREWSVFETDHTELGSWFAEQSGLPFSLVDVIRYHHVPEIAPRHAELVGLTAIADRMSNHFLKHETPEGFCLRENLQLIPRFQEHPVASQEKSLAAIVTLAWTRMQRSTDLSL